MYWYCVVEYYSEMRGNLNTVPMKAMVCFATSIPVSRNNWNTNASSIRARCAFFLFFRQEGVKEAQKLTEFRPMKKDGPKRYNYLHEPARVIDHTL